MGCCPACEPFDKKFIIEEFEHCVIIRKLVN